MKKFQYNLETVLRLRNREAKNEISKLSVIVGEVNRLQKDITENNQSIEDAITDFRVNVVPGSDLRYYKVFGSYIRGKYLQNEVLQETIDKQSELLNNARQKVVEAKKKSEVLEILKQKRYRKFLDRINDLERLEVEEVNSKLYNNKQEEKKNSEEINKNEQRDSHKDPKQDKFLEELDNFLEQLDQQKSEYDKVQEFIQNSQKK